ncbi:hypothetical protein DdX_04275 [Ditylenchus destructor]|uniref:Uncharacterized protein n=1 Tax=Ditylenchus destructor TaxID=166010 RepID=A0AAD4R4D7_9BILA|nr:hypothetical protein DdX_04275 [Ditylenchus destructor]
MGNYRAEPDNKINPHFPYFLSSFAESCRAPKKAIGIHWGPDPAVCKCPSPCSPLPHISHEAACPYGVRQERRSPDLSDTHMAATLADSENPVSKIQNERSLTLLTSSTLRPILGCA